MGRMSNALSDVPVEVDTGEDELATSEPFSFVWLEAFIAQHTQDDDEPVTTRLYQYAFAAVVVFGVIGAVFALVLRNQLGLRILQVSIVLQWLCVATAIVSAGRQAWQFYRRQHEDFARNLDQQLVWYSAIVDAVCRYPLPVICTHLRYVRDRKSRFVYRAGLISGGFDKFGILPLLVMMYLQLKDWAFGDWATLLDHMHLIGNVLLWMLIVTYLISWWALRAKGRLDLYELLLTEASVRAGGQ